MPPPPFEHLAMAAARHRLTTWLRDRMLEQQLRTEMEFGPRTVPEAIIETARLRPGACALRDVTQSLTNRRLLRGAAVLAQMWRELLPPDATRVGVLLPNVNATPLTLLSLWSLGRVPAVLNACGTNSPAVPSKSPHAKVPAPPLTGVTWTIS